MSKCPLGFGADSSNDPEDAGQQSSAFGRPYASPSKPPSSRVPPVRPRRGSKPLYYHTYLGLDQLLSCQKPRSAQVAGPEGEAHDEMLFIVIHQSYELWFKQVLHELNDACFLFDSPELSEKDLSVILARLRRCVQIFKILVSKLSILETMTPLSFLDFREYLYPASGFQSVQWRLIENRLGLRRSQRLHYAQSSYEKHLSDEHAQTVSSAEQERSLFEHVDTWLSRTPFLETKNFDFWTEYQSCVSNLHAAQRAEINLDQNMPEDMKAQRLQEIQAADDSFNEFFDEKKYQQLLDTGRRRLSYTATKAAIMIQLYQEEPVFQLPFQLLTTLLDIDELLTSWRHRHSMMVHRMLGMQVGTGGSSGYNYLRMTASKHKIFADFFDLSMFLIPRSELPSLPRDIVRLIRFHYTHEQQKLQRQEGQPAEEEEELKQSDIEE